MSTWRLNAIHFVTVDFEIGRDRKIFFNLPFKKGVGKVVLLLSFSFSLPLFFFKNLLSTYFVLELGTTPVETTHQAVLHLAGETANNYTVE